MATCICGHALAEHTNWRGMGVYCEVSPCECGDFKQDPTKKKEILECACCGHLLEVETDADPADGGESLSAATASGDCEGCGYPWRQIDHADRVVNGVVGIVLDCVNVKHLDPGARRRCMRVVLAALDHEDPIAPPAGRL